MLYLDSSAIVKLVRREPETTALVEEVRDDPEVVSSALAWTEILRAARRARVSSERATRILEGIALVPIDGGILRFAAELAPTALRTLDAIHLATALSLRDDLASLVTYDDRMAEAAVAAGLGVRSLGRPPPLDLQGDHRRAQHLARTQRVLREIERSFNDPK